MIPYGRQTIEQADIDAVLEVLSSDYLTQGPKVPAFEQTVSGYCGARHAVALNSGTSALHLACLALGMGRGDILWTTPLTFVASANCALYCGGTVDFVDVDPRSCNICPEKLEQKLATAEKNGTLPKVVVPVHLCGHPCDMGAIHALSGKYGFRVIEDASHAIGGKYGGEPIGSCRYSDITIFSFHPVKLITTGEGGMAVTNDAALAEKMALLRSHGITRDPARMTHAPDGPRYYQQIELGFNYRMTDLQAVLGISQMKRLHGFVAKRRELAQRYDRLLNGLPVRMPWRHPDGDSAWHLYVIRLELDKIRKSRSAVFDSLVTGGVGANLHYIPVHTQPWYARMGFRAGMFPEAEAYYREAITLPLFPKMGEDAQNTVVRVLQEALQ